MSRLVALGVGLVLLAGLGCGKHKYGQYDLDSALHKYCIEIRWGRILKAAEHVAPEMRSAFVELWSTRSGRVDIQDLEVVSMAVAGDGDEAQVMLKITYVDNASLRIEQSVLSQAWKRTEYGWFAYDAFDLEGKLPKPAPVAAPADPAPTEVSTGEGEGEPGFGG